MLLLVGIGLRKKGALEQVTRVRAARSGCLRSGTTQEWTLTT
jgi:hypothetical protein